MPTDQTTATTQHSSTEQAIHNSRFLRACRREAVDTTPIWILRQGGRYMAAYRTLRQQYSVDDIMRSAQLQHEITLQPVNAFDLDAAIIFSDILLPLEAMGLDLEFSSKRGGPAIHNPIRTAADVARLRVPPAQEVVPATLEAIRKARASLDARALPLIGFAGAPVTLAAYAIEGGGSKQHLATRAFMMQEPEAWDALLQKLTTVIGHYLLAQADAGANALQLFDSWGSRLSPYDYRRHAAPYSRQVIEIARGAGVPVIHFGLATAALLPTVRDAGSDVVGIDWCVDFEQAAHILGDHVAIQGNLDPAAMLTPWDTLQERAQAVLDQAAQRPGHIFNLGHGIPRETPEDNVKRLVDFVHEYARR